MKLQFKNDLTRKWAYSSLLRICSSDETHGRTLFVKVQTMFIADTHLTNNNAKLLFWARRVPTER